MNRKAHERMFTTNLQALAKKLNIHVENDLDKLTAGSDTKHGLQSVVFDINSMYPVIEVTNRQDGDD